MAIPTGWTPISADIPLGRALLLLQETFVDGQYSHLSVLTLQEKLHPGAPGRHYWLHAFSYGSLRDPDISAFFFLRLRFGPRAFSMTVGATPHNPGPPPVGLDPTALRNELVAIGTYMRDEVARGIQLEFMYEGTGPMFRESPAGNLEQAYTYAKTPASGPLLRVATPPTIQVGPPWVETTTTMTRLLITLP